MPQPSEGEVTKRAAQEKENQEMVKVDDLKPAKDPKGGMPQGPSENVEWILKHLQLGERPPGSTPR